LEKLQAKSKLYGQKLAQLLVPKTETDYFSTKKAVCKGVWRAEAHLKRLQNQIRTTTEVHAGHKTMQNGNFN